MNDTTRTRLPTKPGQMILVTEYGGLYDAAKPIPAYLHGGDWYRVDGEPWPGNDGYLEGPAHEITGWEPLDLAGFLARDAEAEQERRAFTSELGFGDDVTEPAAKLSELIDPLTQALHEAHQHTECPVLCELCGERLADTLCEHCGGSGADNTLSQAHMAYAECEWCAGAQKVHPGCVETSYEDLAAQVEAAREWAKKHAARACGESLVRAIEEAGE